MDTLEEEDDDSPSSNHPFSSFNSFSFGGVNPFGQSTGQTSTAEITGQMPTEGDAAMGEDPAFSWLSMDLDSLLAQSLPPLDMSLYQSMGDLAPIHSDTVPYGQDDFASYMFPLPDTTAVSESTPKTDQKLLHRGGYMPITPQIESMLGDFCEYDRLGQR
jgi:hypothetical protein